MEGAAAPVAGDRPDAGPGALGSPREAVAGATAAPATAAAPEPRKPHGVKRHHHKHNLKHRYELQETLGKGTYGKVKRATERFSGRVVSGRILWAAGGADWTGPGTQGIFASTLHAELGRPGSPSRAHLQTMPQTAYFRNSPKNRIPSWELAPQIPCSVGIPPPFTHLPAAPGAATLHSDSASL
ncbi:hypothetical protein P7K49_020171 [Saguinus oedipus]|uniref:Uncharacterized protein n=1 Tax=Saguinus oedipus TaxID=9490 RepID=A0ABQ9V0F0_SAGOE|nr:hypothetical protein P7K49_020171 [Saguinus oedipus]